MGLDGVLNEIRNDKNRFLAASTGKEFEERIMACFDEQAYTRIRKDQLDDYMVFVKKHTEKKWAIERMPNLSDFQQHYIYEPFGSQKYPDILVFDKDQIYFFEIKFSKNESVKPMWNSGLPRPTGIYIFASYNLKDITFFRGADVISPDEARKFHDIFDDRLRKIQEEFNVAEASSQRRGFQIYVRKAFDQSNKFNTSATVNYFTNPFRAEDENNVIKYVRGEDE